MEPLFNIFTIIRQIIGLFQYCTLKGSGTLYAFFLIAILLGCMKYIRWQCHGFRCQEASLLKN